MKKNNIYYNIEDNALIEKIQIEYNDFRKGGHWLCKCGNKIDYNHKLLETNKCLKINTKCDCGKNVENFILKENKEFISEEFDVIFKRYENKIKSDCFNFKLEEFEEMYSDMYHKFFMAVMTFDKKSCKFYTYLNNILSRRFEDFERKKSRAKRANSVQCQCYGRWVGAITRIHLMNNKIKPKDGFPGHKFLHEQIICSHGEDHFSCLRDDENFAEINSEKWEGNSYNRAQRSVIKRHIVSAYKNFFPNYDISKSDLLFNDIEQESDVEFVNLIEDKKKILNYDTGFHNKDGFYLEGIPSDIEETSEEFSEKISNLVFEKYKKYEKVKFFKNSNNIDDLKLMLKTVFSLLILEYSLEDICTIKGYDNKEVNFWVSKIKNKSPEIFSFK